MVSIPGVDYAWSHPSPAALATAGTRFACRYLSGDASKNLTRAEAAALATVGIWSVVVWESTANRALAGQAAGAADATRALAQATACGMPAGRPIFFAVDFDATPGNQTAINAYLDGAASIIGRSRVGIYGGYYPVKRALDAGKAAWAWQTIAWSGGQWDPRAVIRQGAQTTIGGVSVDLNTATTTDYGQWMPGVLPEETDMPTAAEIADAVVAKLLTGGGALEDSDLDRVYSKLLTTDGMIPAPADASDYATNPFWAWKTHIAKTTEAARQAAAGVAAVQAQLSEIRVALDTLDLATLRTRLQDLINSIDVTLHVSGS